LELESRSRSSVGGDVVGAVVADLVRGEPQVIAAYVFGSVARGTAGPLSDIDIGVLIDDPLSRDVVCARIADAVCRRFGTSTVDVVSLTEAPMPLRYRVVRDGSLVSCRNAAAIERFTVETVLQYLDFKPLRDRAFGHMRAAILDGR
jgi:uncharacterized protein